MTAGVVTAAGAALGAGGAVGVAIVTVDGEEGVGVGAGVGVETVRGRVVVEVVEVAEVAVDVVDEVGATRLPVGAATKLQRPTEEAHHLSRRVRNG